MADLAVDATGAWAELSDAPAEGTFSLAVKANIAVAGFHRSAGSRALGGAAVETADAPVVAAFRRAGARVAGTTNMHELALGVTSENVAWGAARVPGHPLFSAGGSSGGSAAAVADGSVPFALGTDTGGSVSIPASHCGVVGFRPSTGRWPTAGIVGLSWTRDTPGVFTTSTPDAIRADAWVTGSHPAPAPHRPRLGVPRELTQGLSRVTATAFALALDRISKVAEIIDVSFADVLGLTRLAEPRIIGWECPRELATAAAQAFGAPPADALVTLAAQVESADVARFLYGCLDAPVPPDEYAAAVRATADARDLADALLTSAHLDAFVFPTTPAPAPPIGSGGTVLHQDGRRDVFELYTRNTGPGTILGAPMLTLPTVRGDELPVGLTVQGRRNEDARLLALGAGLERLLR